MRNHRLVVSAAFVAAGLALVSVPASAAEVPGGPVPPVPAKAGAAAGARADTGVAKSGETFHSPAGRTVRTVLPGGRNKAADDHPGLAVELTGESYSAHRLGLTTKITGPDAELAVVVDFGDGTTEKKTVKGTGEIYHDHVYAEVGEYVVKVTVTDTAGGIHAANQLTFATAGSEFTPLAPTRLLDTRDGTGTTAGKVAGRGTTRVQVAGGAGIPAGATAVVLNVTVTNTTDDGHVTVYPGKGSRPDTSNLNYTAGQSVPNLVIVPVGEDGSVELFNGGWNPVDLVADVTGYFVRSAASGYTSITPTRFVDTREGLGVDRGRLAGRGTFTTRVGGLKGVPEGITAVALNVTVTNPAEAGHLSVFPAGGGTPTASNLNFTAGQTIANSVIVPVSADGRISVFNGAWAGTDVIVDVVGHYGRDSKGAYRPIGPRRSIDTRIPGAWPSRLPARGYFSQWFAPEPDGAPAFVFNTTVTNTVDSGFLSVAPSPLPWLENTDPNAPKPPRPVSSALNWTKGATVPNLVQTGVGEYGIINFWNQGWKDADLIVDVFGIYEPN
ncbi:PKD domain-containing protein [Streptomyces yangpuensis]|uniref:PKD domain-containing protein n=1 Tax=Streptomyces yangpuensis TaxID=1648182 RepID=UPI0037F26977